MPMTAARRSYSCAAIHSHDFSISVRFLQASPARRSRRATRGTRSASAATSSRARGDFSATFASTSTATPVVFGSSAAAILSAIASAVKRADADVVAARAQRDVNDFTHGFEHPVSATSPSSAKPAEQHVARSPRRRGHRCRRARGHGRRTAVAPRAGCAPPRPDRPRRPAADARRPSPRAATASSAETLQPEHAPRRQHRLDVLLAARRAAAGRHHRFPASRPPRAAPRSRASGTRPPPPPRRCPATVFPAASSMTLSRSTNAQSRRSASSRPTVVFPDAMKPIRKIGASSSAGGMAGESYSIGRRPRNE